MIVTDAVLVKLGLVEPCARRCWAVRHRRRGARRHHAGPGRIPCCRLALRPCARTQDVDPRRGRGSAIDAAKVIGAMAVLGKSPAKLIGMLGRSASRCCRCLRFRPRQAPGPEVTVVAVTDPVKHVKSAVIDPKLVPLPWRSIRC